MDDVQIAVGGAKPKPLPHQAVLDARGAQPMRLLHGMDATAWPLLREASRRGYPTRIGYEDVLILPNGSPAASNADLIQAALALLQYSI